MDIKEWVREQNRFNTKRQILDSPDIRVEHTGAGDRLMIANPVRPSSGGGGASSVSQYMCKMTSGYTSGADGFPVTVYDSLGGSALGNSTISVPLIFLAANDSLPVGGWIIGNVIAMTVIGDGTGV